MGENLLCRFRFVYRVNIYFYCHRGPVYWELYFGVYNLFIIIRPHCEPNDNLKTKSIKIILALLVSIVLVGGGLWIG